MTRKSKPWAVILSTPDGHVRTEHTSKAKAYAQVNAERAAITDGVSDTDEINVEQWEPSYGRWSLYETAYPAE
jgi:hypothetical protein